MNNLTIGGIDPRSGLPYTYYETIAGGLGASPSAPGASGHHAHMTNSLNTPVEALEYAYPFRMIRYAVRRGSGGRGRNPGGDGLVREIELSGDAQVTLLADRRTHRSHGVWPAANPALRAKPLPRSMEWRKSFPANSHANCAPAAGLRSSRRAAVDGELLDQARIKALPQGLDCGSGGVTLEAVRCHAAHGKKHFEGGSACPFAGGRSKANGSIVLHHQIP